MKPRYRIVEMESGDGYHLQYLGPGQHNWVFVAANHYTCHEKFKHSNSRLTYNMTFEECKNEIASHKAYIEKVKKENTIKNIFEIEL